MKTNIKTTPLASFTSVNVEERTSLGIRAGDTVKVWVKITEKGKVRLQAFEGLVLATKHGGEPGATFTVRKVSNGVGVERIFPLFSPNIDKIEIVKRARVRRAKLYHIREKVAREIKRQMRRTKLTSIATLSDTEEKERVQKEADAAAEAEAKAAEEKAAAEQEAKAVAEAEAQAAEQAPETENTEVSEDSDAPADSQDAPDTSQEDAKDEAEEKKD